MKIDKISFGQLDNGELVHLYEMDNGSMQVKITNYGCIISSIKVPNQDGEWGEVVLGFDKLEDYKKSHPYFGAIVGPVANRISNAKFTLDGTLYVIDANEGVNQLHGGSYGFDKVAWFEKEIIQKDNLLQIEFGYHRPNGLMGYPGDLEVTFRISMYPNNRLDLNYYVVTNQPTLVNLTHHDYFNLLDGGGSKITNHLLQINASHYTPTKDDNCVTGDILNVDGTPFDFKKQIRIKDAIENLYGKPTLNRGFDHNFVLTNESPIAATLQCQESGRQLDIYTNMPCVQFYTAEHLDGSLSRGDVVFNSLNALCLETQSFPDAINQPRFPSNTLYPNETYDYFTSYVFSIL